MASPEGRRGTLEQSGRLVEAEVARLRAHGIAMRNELMDFHSRKLIFVKGPEGITVELSQWEEPRIAR